MKKVIVMLFCVMSILSYGAFIENATVIVNQSTLNLFLAAIGPVTGSDSYNVSGLKGKYTWTIENAKIEIEKDAARFTGDATINAGGTSYKSQAVGAVEVKYEKETNKIFVKILEAKIDIAVKAFGKKVKITEVDVAQYYRPEFQFAGPQPIQSTIELKMPDGSVRVVNITSDPAMRLEKEMIIVSSQLTFTPAK